MDGLKLGCGTLHVAVTDVSGGSMALGWVADSLECSKMGLRAISRGISPEPQKHLYAGVNGKLTDENEARMNDGDEDFFFFFFILYIHFRRSYFLTKVSSFQ